MDLLRESHCKYDIGRNNWKEFLAFLKGIHLVLLNRLNVKKNDGRNNGFCSIENFCRIR